MSKIASIFQPEPQRWGLRGDPKLWQYLHEHFVQFEVDLPCQPKLFVDECLKIITHLIGKSPQLGQSYYVELFASPHVGMSSGWISGEFWLETAIPLLVDRLKRANQGLK